MSHYQLDVRGLLCPIPLIKTERKSKSLAPGDSLEVLGDDPTMLQDIPAWCQIRKHSVLAIKKEKGIISITFQVK